MVLFEIRPHNNNIIIMYYKAFIVLLPQSFRYTDFGRK